MILGIGEAPLLRYLARYFTGEAAESRSDSGGEGSEFYAPHNRFYISRF
jgi:hypothetical protein